MFCIKCGKELKDGDVFCPNCGQKTRVMEMQSPQKTVRKYSLSGSLKIFGKNVSKKVIMAALALATAAVIIIFVFFRTPAYEKPVHNLANVFNSGDLSLMTDVFPIEYLDDTYKSSFYEMLGDPHNTAAYDEKVSMSVSYAEKMSSSEISEEMSDLFWYFENVPEISEGYFLTVKITMTYADGSQEDNTVEMKSIKIGGKWYLSVTDFLF